MTLVSLIINDWLHPQASCLALVFIVICSFESCSTVYKCKWYAIIVNQLSQVQDMQKNKFHAGHRTRPPISGLSRTFQNSWHLCIPLLQTELVFFICLTGVKLLAFGCLSNSLVTWRSLSTLYTRKCIWSLGNPDHMQRPLCWIWIVHAHSKSVYV